MRLHIYHGLDDEEIPKDVTHVIVDSSVTVIKEGAFYRCHKYLVSVIMGDDVKRIEEAAFFKCWALRFIRLSRTLEYIGDEAFRDCESLEALFLSSTIKKIEHQAFYCCQSLRLIILPHDIDVDNVGMRIIDETAILRQIAENAGVAYEWNDNGDVTDESVRRVKECLFHHMDEWPFHKLCYDSSVATKHINEYLKQNGADAALAIDSIHGMTPLHILSMNPHTPVDTILTLLEANINVANVEDNRGKTSLFYALHYNPCAFVRMYSYLREHTIDIGIDIQSWRVDWGFSWCPTLQFLRDINELNDPGCTALNVLVKNPFVPATVIAAFLELEMEAAFWPDNGGLLPLDHAKECNVGGLVSMIVVLCNHRYSVASI